MGVLDRILSQKRAELPELRARRLPAPPPRPAALGRRLPGSPLQLITEIKLKSPSAGPLSRALSVEERAARYEAGGASMISVLCDRTFFDGDYEHLTRARQGTSLPLLCKEFILDEVQLDCAAAYGASAALLIVRCLDEETLPRLVRAAEERGLTPLVEIATEEEAARALDAGARWVGVNARDLDTLVMDAARAARVLERLPEDIARAHFSGVKTPEDVAQVAASGVDAALIGEVLMRQDDPSELLTRLHAAARP